MNVCCFLGLYFGTYCSGSVGKKSVRTITAESSRKKGLLLELFFAQVFPLVYCHLLHAFCGDCPHSLLPHLLHSFYQVTDIGTYLLVGPLPILYVSVNKLVVRIGILVSSKFRPSPDVFN
jgi:hypothetical protein